MDDPQKTISEVREMLEKALEDREVFIHLNGEADGVSLPEALAGNPNVTLKLSYYYRGPLVIGDETVEAELLFPEGSHNCIVPMKHIWGITQTSGESMFWPEHAPRQVLEEMIRGVAGETEKTDSDKSEASHKADLQAVPAAQSDHPEEPSGSDSPKPEEEDPTERDSDKQKKSPPKLKRIK